MYGEIKKEDFTIGSKRRNGEGSIRQKSNGCYEVRISGVTDFQTGKKTRISRYAATEQEAVQLLHSLSVTVGSKKITNMTLGEWLDFWMEVYARNTLKQSTQMSYETYAKRHFKPALGDYPLTEITPRLLQQLYNYKVQTEGLSPKAISNLNLYLHKALEQAVREGLIPTNPASALNLPHVERPTIDVLTREEQGRLVQASYQHRYGVFIRLVLATGLRLGELLGLRWENINFRSNMLNVCQTLNRLQIPGLPDNYSGPKTEIVIQPPKSANSLRSIPLLPGAVQDLLCWRSVQEADQQAAGDAYVNSGFVVTNPLGGYIEPRTFSDYYHRILDLAGLRHFNFHALRHTFATRAMEQGMDEKTLSTLLGHYSISFTMDTYAHVLDTHKWEGINLMNDLYSAGQPAIQPQGYPILVTPQDGSFLVNAPDFPEIQVNAPTMETGVEHREKRSFGSTA